MTRDWLPNKIDRQKYSTFKDFIDDVYNIFVSNFYIDKIVFKNINVHVAEKLLNCENSDNCESLEYECSDCPFKNKHDIFNHVVTGKNINHRTPGKFNINRAIRINWIKPIISNVNSGLVLYFCENINNRINHYFWLKSEKYIVIVEENAKNKMYLKTAFYIDIPTYEKKFAKKYENYNKTKKGALRK